MVAFLEKKSWKSFFRKKWCSLCKKIMIAVSQGTWVTLQTIASDTLHPLCPNIPHTHAHLCLWSHTPPSLPKRTSASFKVPFEECILHEGILPSVLRSSRPPLVPSEIDDERNTRHQREAVRRKTLVKSTRKKNNYIEMQDVRNSVLLPGNTTKVRSGHGRFT